MQRHLNLNPSFPRLTFESRSLSANPATSDEVLIGRIANGDRLAMQVLFARHHVRVFRFVLRLVRNEATAEDLISEVFLDVWRQAGQVRGQGCGFDLAARDRPLQGVVGAAAQAGAGAGRGDGGGDRGHVGHPRRHAGEEGQERSSSGSAWRHFPPNTGRSSISCTTTRNRSRRWPRSSASRKRPSRRACSTRGRNWQSC